jgi:AcrR family transcriptional regulator
MPSRTKAATPRKERVSRAEQSARNREAILRSARTVFLRSGYHGTTVEAVAREAGLTIGAIYSRFDGKADLFLALLEERIAERAEQFAGLAQASLIELRKGRPEPARDAARRWAAIMKTDLDWSLLVIEFRVHAARDRALNARYAELHERVVAGLVANIADSLPPDVATPKARMEHLARAALALSTGAALARAVGPDAFDDDLYEEASFALGAHLLALADGSN